MLSNLIIQVDHYIAFKFVLLQGSFICSKSLISMIFPVVTFDFLAYTLKSLLFFSRLKFCHNFSNFYSSSISPRSSIPNSTLSESNFLIIFILFPLVMSCSQSLGLSKDSLSAITIFGTSSESAYLTVYR